MYKRRNISYDTWKLLLEKGDISAETEASIATRLYGLNVEDIKDFRVVFANNLLF